MRAIAYFSVRELIPLYAVYALLFADHGLSDAAISSLFVVWSVTAFVTEVPSGAWADTVPRRNLLILSSVLYGIGFSLWLLVPGYLGFAAGFVLWGLSGSLMSGTFEALLYDALAEHGATAHYGRLLGWANAAALVAVLVATAAAGPLLARGGYALVGWVSVAVAFSQGAVALTLPRPPRVMSVEDLGAPAERGLTRYVAMLRSGTAEATRNRTVRHAVLVSALLMGFLAYDEYFPLVAREQGAATADVPLLMALTVAGQVLGTSVAGWTGRLGRRTLAWCLAAGGLLLAAGVLRGGAVGFAAVAAGYGVMTNLIIVSEARLQDVIEGPARATVTSASGLLSEVAAVGVFTAIAVGTRAWSVTVLVAALTVPVLALSALLPRWLPATAAPAAPDPAE